MGLSVGLVVHLDICNRLECIVTENNDGNDYDDDDDNNYYYLLI